MRRSSCALLAFVASAFATLARAQCTLDWDVVGAYPGANATIYASTNWDPDGPGPAAETIVFGGAFTVVGDAVASRIASFDVLANHCAALGSGMNDTVYALLALPNGDLIAGGAFTVAGGAAANHVAIWNGVGWQSLGVGLGGDVRALARLPNGDIVAAGDFTASGGATVQRIARWDGVAWQPLGTGLDNTVLALALAANGDLFAGGTFTTAGGIAAQRVARWSGGQWGALGSGCNNPVNDLQAMPNGDLVAAGAFTTGGSAPYVAATRWNGVLWSSMILGGGSPFELGQSLQLMPNGDLVLGTVGAFGQGGIYRWTGAWQVIQGVGVPGTVCSVNGVLTDVTGALVAAGDFRGPATTAGLGTLRVMRLAGGVPQPLGAVDGPVVALGSAANGGVLAIGQVVDRVIKAWSPAGGWRRFSTVAIAANAITGLANGDAFACGSYSQTFWPPFGSPYTVYSSFARVTPTSATYFGGFTAYSIIPEGKCLTRFANGDVLAASTSILGGSDVYRYSSLGGGLGQSFLPATPRALAVDGNGNQFAAAAVAVWRMPSSGPSWSQLGMSFDNWCHALCATAGGAVIAGGEFTSVGGVPVNRVATWNGTSWQPLGSGCDGPVFALAALPNGDVIAGGAFTTAGGVPAANLARWNGASWSQVAGGTDGAVRALLCEASGNVWVGGDFATVGGRGCGFVARLSTPCQPSSASFGTGCQGSGGLNTLAAVTLPWQGGVFRSHASGLSQGIAIALHGLAPVSVPLSQVLPIGVPGCDLLVAPILLDLLVPVAGTADLVLPLPATAVVPSQLIFQQIVSFEFDSFGGLSNLTSTNGLRLVVGAL
jgi:hypothetical protein